MMRSEWIRSSRPGCATKRMPACHKNERDNNTMSVELTYPKLGRFHLCATAVADDEAVWTARDIVVT